MIATAILFCSVLLSGILSYCFNWFEPRKYIDVCGRDCDANERVKHYINHYRKIWKV